MLLGALVLVAGLVVVAIPHHPSTGQRAADLRSLVRQLGTDIESCAGANQATANCSAANNMQLEDLVQVQVPESLASFGLDRAVLSLRQWAAPDAARVCADVAALLRASPASRGAASSQLRADLAVLDAERTRFSHLLGLPNGALGAHVTLPDLPG
jgi:hypothetical protein